MDRPTRSSEAGIALLAVLLGLALLGTVAAAVVAVGIVEYRTSRDYLAATKAALVADAGAAHALALIRGPLRTYTFSELLLGPDGKPSSASSCGVSYKITDVNDPYGDSTSVKAVGCFDEDLDGYFDANDDCVCAGQPTSGGDDGVLAGYTQLTEPDKLPDTGVAFGDGTYRVHLINDPFDPSQDAYVDSNDRVVAVCRGESAGGVAEVKVMLEAKPYPAVVVNGFLRMSANAAIEGPCAGAHANGDLEVSTGVTVQGPITASDSVTHWWYYGEEANHATEIRSHAPPIEVPKMDPLDYCADADYVLRDGWKVNMTATPDSTYLGGGTDWSWSKASNTYKLGGQPSNLGTFCAHGNISYTASIGSETEPAPITLIATGAISLGGKSRIAPAHPDGLLIVAGGDIAIGGQAGARYSGLIYTENQCVFGGNATVEALVLCYDDPDSWSIEATDITDWNEIGSSTTISYDCSGPRQSPRVTAWWE